MSDPFLAEVIRDFFLQVNEGCIVVLFDIQSGGIINGGFVHSKLFKCTYESYSIVPFSLMNEMKRRKEMSPHFPLPWPLSDLKSSSSSLMMFF